MLAQLPEAATPTTIVGAFILVCVTLVGAVVWLMKHVFSTTIPDQNKLALAISENFKTALATVTASGDTNQQAMRDEQCKMREQHTANLKEVLVTVQAEAAAERKLCADQFAALNATVAGLATGLTAQRDAIVATVNQHTTEQCAAYRHDLYDKLNQAVMEDALYKARKARGADEEKKL